MKVPRPGARVWPIALALVALPTVVGHAAKWNPVDPAELALTTPRVEKGADAEALIWDVSVHDVRVGSDVQMEREHYIRIKLFTDRGREAQSRVDIPHTGGVRIRDVEGRTIKRDGTTVELKGSDVYERDIVKTGGRKLRATSFVLPGTETGGLIEYRWREIHDDELSHNVRLPFSRDIPVQVVNYHISPIGTLGTLFTMRGRPFHCTPPPLVREGPGKFRVSLTDVPAFHDEPLAPSEWEVQPWFFIYYDYRDTKNTALEFWAEWSRETAKELRKATTPTDQVRRAAAALTPADASVAASSAAILDYLRAHIKRMDLDTTSQAERKDFKGNKDLDEALTKGRGTSWDVKLLFVSMARARNLDARLAAAPSRDDIRYSAEWMLPQLFEHSIAVIRDGAEWRFYDPGRAYAAGGTLDWTQEGLKILIPDEKQVITAEAPVSAPSANLRKRTAHLRLLDDGTIEGDVSGEMSGHTGTAFKNREDGLSPAEREKALSESVTTRLPGAELTNLKVEHVTDPDVPYTYAYHLRLPGYAQRAGSRWLLQPEILQKGVEPEFGADQRRNPIYFRYAWQEIDDIEIRLPDGFQAEPGTIAPDLPLNTVGGHRLTMTVDGSILRIHRDLRFGEGARLEYEPAMYWALKRFFDDVVRRDSVTVSIRKAAGQ
jgi:hypothetical protein